MPIYHQGRKVKEVHHQGRKVKELWYMGRKIYTSFTPRVFTVRLDPGGLLSSPSWNTGSVTGDNTLVQSISGGGLYLAANATYTRTDGKTSGLSANGAAVRASELIPKGAQLTGTAGTYTFTELAPIVEVMPPTPGDFDARDWLRATVQKYGLDYTTVTELPFDIDSRNATTMREMFNGCSSLTTVPQMDTSKVTDMSWMFTRCSSLTTVPQMDTSNVTNMNRMFNSCSSLTTVPQMNTSNVTTFDYMFTNCRSLTDGNVALTVKRKGASTYSMITNSGLTREPFLTIK